MYWEIIELFICYRLTHRLEVWAKNIYINPTFVAWERCDSNFTYWIWKKHDIYRVYVGKVSWELLCSPWQKNTKQLLNWHLLLHCKPAKIMIDNSRSDWFSKANTLVWAEPCARCAELKMLSFWAGGISSFPPCAREYRLLRRLRAITFVCKRWKRVPFSSIGSCSDKTKKGIPSLSILLSLKTIWQEC